MTEVTTVLEICRNVLKVVNTLSKIRRIPGGHLWQQHAEGESMVEKCPASGGAYKQKGKSPNSNLTNISILIEACMQWQSQNESVNTTSKKPRPHC